MPPQQSDRPLDVFDNRLNFRAHESTRLPAEALLTNRRAFSESWRLTQPTPTDTASDTRSAPIKFESEKAIES
jgi:hypothetical protein